MSIPEAAPDDDRSSDLEARLTALERDVRTLTAAIDAASRMRISSLRLYPNLRVAGGKKVRRILERGGLVEGYPEQPDSDS
jgi:hypothetical protein